MSDPKPKWRCLDCAHVAPSDFGDNRLTCDGPLVQYGYPMDHDPPEGGILVDGDGGWGITVDADFGCVNFEPREEDPADE